MQPFFRIGLSVFPDDAFKISHDDLLRWLEITNETNVRAVMF